MPVNQRLGLVTLEFCRVFGITLEIPRLQDRPIDLVQMRQVGIEIRPLIVGMATLRASSLLIFRRACSTNSSLRASVDLIVALS